MAIEKLEFEIKKVNGQFFIKSFENKCFKGEEHRPSASWCETLLSLNYNNNNIQQQLKGRRNLSVDLLKLSTDHFIKDETQR